jgi:hypothetical protein
MGSIAASPSLGLILILSHAHASGFILSSEHTKSCPTSVAVSRKEMCRNLLRFPPHPCNGRHSSQMARNIP